MCCVFKISLLISSLIIQSAVCLHPPKISSDKIKTINNNAVNSANSYEIPKEPIDNPSIFCTKATEKSLKTLEQLKEYCHIHYNGEMERGILHPVPGLEVIPENSIVRDNSEESEEAWTPPGHHRKESLPMQQLATITGRSRSKRIEPINLTHEGDHEEHYDLYDCYGCITKDEKINFIALVKFENITDCGDEDCGHIVKISLLTDIFLAALFALIFCLIVLGILSCLPAAADGRCLALLRCLCSRRSNNSYEVRYRNQTLDSNDFSIVDFE